MTLTLIATAPPRIPVVEAPQRPSRLVPVIVIGFTVLAAALRLYRLSFGYAHPIVDYDGGVYFGSSLALVEGHLPYRDYAFVQPPAITVLFAPVALLAKLIGTGQAMGLAKVLTGLAGAASVPLVARLVRHRGPFAVAAACAVTALQTDAVSSAYTLLLEPWLVLFCLIGAGLVFDGDQIAGRRRLGWGGVLFGLACATKIWAVAPALAVALVCRRRPGVARYLIGAVAGFLVTVLPFAVLAPGAVIHQVFSVQLERSAADRTTVAFRLVHMFASAPPDSGATRAGWPVLLTVAVVLLSLLGLAWLRRRPGNPLERFAVLAAGLVVAMMLVPAAFYWHYAAFSTPFLALAAVLPLRALSRPARRAWCATLAAGVLALSLVTAHRDASAPHPLDNHRTVDALVPAGACVVSSMASASIAQDRFFADDPGCPVLLDPFGAVLAATGGETPSPRTVRTPAVTRLWLRLYQRADYVYLQRRVAPLYPTSGPAQRYLDAHFAVVLHRGRVTLYERVRP